MTAKQKAEALKTLIAARRLVKKSWIQGQNHTQTMKMVRGQGVWVDSYCSLGAIRKADGPGEPFAIAILAKSIFKLFGKAVTYYNRPTNYPDFHIVNFNDLGQFRYDPRPGETTKKDVIAAFDAAIEMAGGSK